MRKSMIAAALAGLLAVTTAAIAAEVKMEGKIEDINAEARTITLTTGETFDVAEGVDISQLEADDTIAVTYDTQNDKMIATEISPME